MYNILPNKHFSAKRKNLKGRYWVLGEVYEKTRSELLSAFTCTVACACLCSNIVVFPCFCVIFQPCRRSHCYSIRSSLVKSQNCSLQLHAPHQRPIKSVSACDVTCMLCVSCSTSSCCGVVCLGHGGVQPRKINLKILQTAASYQVRLPHFHYTPCPVQLSLLLAIQNN